MIDRTNAERQARWRERQRAKRAAADEDGLKRARRRIAELEAANLALRHELAARDKERPAPAPRPPRPPPDPDSEVAQLRKRLREMHAQYRHVVAWHEEQLQRAGKVSHAAYLALAKCCHPDARPSEAQRHRAMQLLNELAPGK